METAKEKNITAEDIKKQLKPLSQNGFAAFFQRLWRGWLTKWYSFADKHPKASKIIYMLVFFMIFSQGVTILQFLIMTFMPYLFGGLNQQSFIWPAVELKGLFDPQGNQMFYAIFNEPAAVQGKLGGLGNFLAFEIAVFIAQCINFPLQRNITFKSHGNPWIQAMWYFIGWVLISIFVNAVWGIVNPFMLAWDWNFVIVGLIKTFITGGLSMAIFFPIFLIIFPDYNAMEKRALKKLEKLQAANADADKINKAKQAHKQAVYMAALANAEKAEAIATVQANSKAMAYLAAEKNHESAKDEVKMMELFKAAADAITLKEDAIAARKAAEQS